LTTAQLWTMIDAVAEKTEEHGVCIVGIIYSYGTRRITVPINSRQKGAAGEREFAKYLRDRGIEARRGQQYSGSPDSPDVVSDLSGVHWEVKRTERINGYTALDQAQVDSGQGEVPIVAHRRNGRPWMAMLAMDDLMPLLELAELVGWPRSPA